MTRKQFSLRRQPLPSLLSVLMIVSAPLSATDKGVKEIHRFFGGDGQSPASNLIADKVGNLYGTTEYGGVDSFYGTVFELTY